MLSSFQSHFNTDIWLVALFCSLLFAFALTLGFSLSTKIRDRKLQHQFKHGKSAEEKAAKYLQKHGYHIIDRQVRSDSSFFIDGKERSFKTWADFIAEKSGRKYLVEVKTGDDANPVHANTRRQLFEYSTLYDVNSLILFDADRECHYFISFDKSSAATTPKPVIRWIAVALAAGVLLGIVIGISVRSC